MKLRHIATALALGGLLAATAQAAVVSITPAVSTHAVGDTFTLDVKISGLGTEIVSAFDLNIYFDSAKLKGLSYTLGSGLGGAWDDSGTVLGNNFDQFAFSKTFDPQKSDQENDDDLAALQTDDAFTLLTLTFEAIGAGVSQVDFGLGANERDVVGRNAAFLQNQYAGACVAVGAVTCDDNNVPEPASYGLVAMALLAAGAARRRAA